MVHLMILYMIIQNMITVMSAEVTATGKITCFGNPVKFARVTLYDEDVGFDDAFGEATTNEDGEFEISGDATDGLFGGDPEPYIEVEYLYEGSIGTLRIATEQILGTTASDATGTRGYDEEINFGTIDFETLECNTYVNVLKAMLDFKDRTGLNMPYDDDGLLTVILNFPAIIVPFSTTDTIRVPSGYNNDMGLDEETALHEFAHTIRQSYDDDGSETHFLVDVAQYQYTQQHECSSDTNEGFAFNEGWAEFWASSCLEFDGTDYTIEGNVASALRRLQSECGSTDFRMVNVLRSTEPPGIHSFGEFNDRHDDLYNCQI